MAHGEGRARGRRRAGRGAWLQADARPRRVQANSVLSAAMAGEPLGFCALQVNGVTKDVQLTSPDIRPPVKQKIDIASPALRRQIFIKFSAEGENMYHFYQHSQLIFLLKLLITVRYFTTSQLAQKDSLLFINLTLCICAHTCIDSNIVARRPGAVNMLVYFQDAGTSDEKGQRIDPELAIARAGLRTAAREKTMKTAAPQRFIQQTFPQDYNLLCQIHVQADTKIHMHFFCTLQTQSCNQGSLIHRYIHRFKCMCLFKYMH